MVSEISNGAEGMGLLHVQLILSTFQCLHSPVCQLTKTEFHKKEQTKRTNALEDERWGRRERKTRESPLNLINRRPLVTLVRGSPGKLGGEKPECNGRRG